MRIIAAALSALALLASTAVAQTPQPGNTLITPLRSTQTFIIDIDTNTLLSWQGDNGAGHTVYLLPDLSVLRGQGDPNGAFGGGGSGGHLQRVDLDGNTVWEYFFSNESHQQHHDLEPMPNGNVLLIAWEIVTPEQAVEAGRTATINGNMWPTLLVELEPVGSNDANIVWEWRIWDHIVQDSDPSKPNYGVIAEHPERIDVNLGNVQRSWDHGNYVDYDPVYDQVILSCRRLNEVIVIDHSTTTEEARGSSGGRYGMGGDILYRWGNPQNYGHGDADDQVFWGVHGANFIDPGLPGSSGILAFNNGAREGDDNDRSSVVELQPQRNPDGSFYREPGMPFGPEQPDWIYEEGAAFYSLRYGSAYRMPNGNTLICEGVDGLIFEVTPDKNRVWAYLEPVGNGVFAAQRYWPGRFVVDGIIDIAPGKCPNVVPLPAQVGAGRGNNNHNNAHSNRGGIVHVAIVGSMLLDVGLVDPASITLAGVPALRTRIVDSVDPSCGHGDAYDRSAACDCEFKGDDYSDRCNCTCRGPDGYDDLFVDFSLRELIEALGTVAPGDLVDVTLMATMLDGKRFEASDAILFYAPHGDDDDANDGENGDDSRDSPVIGDLRATPNPFNPSTTIHFSIARPQHVRLAVYDVRGRLVERLVDQELTAGEHAVDWQARRAPSGVYFYRIESRTSAHSGRLILLK